MSHKALKFGHLIPNLHLDKIVSLSIQQLYTQQRKKACSKTKDNPKNAQKYLLRNSKRKDGVNLEPNLVSP